MSLKPRSTLTKRQIKEISESEWLREMNAATFHWMESSGIKLTKRARKNVKYEIANPVPNIHVYSSPLQPFICYKDDCWDGRSYIVRHKAREHHRCDDCHRMRLAKNLRVQVYYDIIWVTCAEGCTPRRIK